MRGAHFMRSLLTNQDTLSSPSVSSMDVPQGSEMNAIAMFYAGTFV